MIKAETVRQEIIRLSENDDVRVVKLDLSDLQSVKEAAQDILDKERQLDIIVNNAGLYFAKGLTKDKFNIIFGANYVGHFLLNYLLLELIIRSDYARIVSVSSMMYSRAKNLDFTRKNESGEKYPFLNSYEISKLAMVLHMKYLAKLLKEYGVKTYAVHPGMVDTGIFQGMENHLNPCSVGVFQCVKRFKLS